MRPTTKVTTMGNRIFSVWDTGRRAVILILRSLSVVNSFMKGGWIMGIKAM